jgi:hypothetical protein
MRCVEIPGEWFPRDAQGTTDITIDADKVTHVRRNSLWMVYIHFIGGTSHQLNFSSADEGREEHYQELLDMIFQRYTPPCPS